MRVGVSSWSDPEFVRAGWYPPELPPGRRLDFYAALGIDPATKALVFSNALDVPGALALWEAFEGMIMTSFGIGTHLSNDVGVPALAAVLKMETCDGMAVAKLSDEPAKATCPDPAHLRALARRLRRGLPGRRAPSGGVLNECRPAMTGMDGRGRGQPGPEAYFYEPALISQVSPRLRAKHDGRPCEVPGKHGRRLVPRGAWLTSQKLCPRESRRPPRDRR